MKKLLLILLLLQLNSILFSQVLQVPGEACGTETPTLDKRIQLEEALNKVASARNAGTDCIPIKFHVVREDDGSGGATLEELAIGVANLNASFLSSGLEYYICGGINYIDNSDFYDFDTGSPDNDVEDDYCDSEDVTNAVNIYVMNTIYIGDFAAAGYAYFPFDEVKSTRIFMRISAMTGAPNSTLTHEFGHHYSLYHTHQGTENGPDDPGAERVLRSGSQANCDMTGDLLCDTDADPRYDSANFDYGTCTYTGNEMDDLGYVYTPPINNIMSYYPDKCGGIFTPEQFTRIASGYALRLTHSSYDFSCAPTSVTAPTLNSVAFNYNTGSMKIKWIDNASNELGYLIERSTTSSTSGFEPIVYGGTGADDVEFYDRNVSGFQRYWYRVKAINGDCNNYSNVLSDSVGLIHCITTVQSNAECGAAFPCYIDDFGITNSDISYSYSNNNSGCSTLNTNPPRNYVNYKNDSNVGTIEVEAGKTYDWTADGNQYFRHIGLFIDLNADADFDDTAEVLYFNTTQFTSQQLGTFTVDSSAIPGTSVFRLRSTNLTPLSDACISSPFGEIEDYEVDIINNIPEIHEAQGCVVSMQNVSGNSFTQFYFNGDLIAEINPNGQDLGAVTIDVNDLDSVKQTTTNQYYLPRNWNISSTIAPTTDVTVRLYALDQELTDYNTKSGNNFNKNDLVISYFDNNGTDDCDFFNNDRNTGTEGTAVSTAINYDVATTDGFYKEFDIDHFTEFAMAGAALLPINFVSFDATLIEDRVELNWGVLSTLACAKYEIQKSSDGKVFHTIGTISCRESANQLESHQFVDKKPFMKQNYYRIKQIDVDGKSITTDTRLVYRKSEAEKVRFYPNPVNNKLVIDFNQDEIKYSTISMYNSTGSLVYEKISIHTSATYTIDCSELKTGVYFIRVNFGVGNVRSERIVVQ